MKTHCSLLAFFGAATVALGDVTLAPLFVDHAVLQRDKPVPVWGWAEPGEKVAVSFAGQTRTVVAGTDRRWSVKLDALAATAVGAELTATGKNTLVVRDVVVGEVWLCSGQSNMEWPLRRAANAPQEIAAANFPLLRHIEIARTVAAQPADTVATSGWKPATPENAGAFTAVGYFFAREIHRKLGVPIGLIHGSWGGTPVESWLSSLALGSDPAFKVVGERWQQTLAEFPARKQAHDAALTEWTKAEEAAKAKSAAAHTAFLAQSPRPRAPRGAGDSWTPAGPFNGMIYPLLPYGLRGVLWYQGESNFERAAEYRLLFGTMIAAWRVHFAQGDIPFYWVNLAGFGLPEDKTGRGFAFLREAQTQTLAFPNTGQAIAIDVGDPKTVHPLNKQEVGRRLALLAKNRIYGIVGDDTGPTFASATVEHPAKGAGAGMRVRFEPANGGLIARDKPPQALELAGADRVFHPAMGRIERDTLWVTSHAVKEPVAVRYAWTNAPEANLYDGYGLPAVPFRSDTW